MTATTAPHEPDILMRWTLTTAGGWLGGVVIAVILALAWGLVGGQAHFLWGLGLSLGVGFTQSRLAGSWVARPGRWMWATIVGMTTPFLLWDIAALADASSMFALWRCVLAGAVLVGILQYLLLRPRGAGAAWWIPASLVGWGLPALAREQHDHAVTRMMHEHRLLTGAVRETIATFALLFGGIILGLVTAFVLRRLASREAA